MVGVMWCFGFVWLRILAAEYCTYWSLSRVLLGTLNMTPLQYPRQEVLNACMRVSATESASEGQSPDVFLKQQKVDLVTDFMCDSFRRGQNLEQHLPNIAALKERVGRPLLPNKIGAHKDQGSGFVSLASGQRTAKIVSSELCFSSFHPTLTSSFFILLQVQKPLYAEYLCGVASRRLSQVSLLSSPFISGVKNYQSIFFFIVKYELSCEINYFTRMKVMYLVMDLA